MENSALIEIPQPPETLLIGNLLDLDRAAPVQGLARLARQYGPIFKLRMRKTFLVVVSGHRLAEELCDEKRFDKSIAGALSKVRKFAGDGLFTSRTDEPNWSKAHNILLPTFSARAMRSYHEMMLDIAGQLAAKWSRLNADDEIDVARDMTSLTLDTIGLCGFDYRFNSFYRESSHPFVGAMVDALSCAMEQVRRLPLEDWIRIGRDRRFAGDIEYMNGMVDRIVRERREAGDETGERRDLLAFMLAGVDKKSGERLDDLNIRYQIITFLIAGHETTSGLLSFAINALVNNPDVLRRAYEEVDRTLGPDREALPTYAQVNQLGYLNQILKETLRLWPTAPAASSAARHARPLLALYGSNLGTAEEIARRIAQDADARGFSASSAPLDDYAGRLPGDGAVIIVTASYNGTPPDNAAKFCAWLGDGMASNALSGVRYAVFGCGNRDWAATFQAIPRLIDGAMESHGAERIVARGEGDARDDFDGQFQGWSRSLWPAVAEKLDVALETAAAAHAPLYAVEVVPGDGRGALAEPLAARTMRIVEIRELHNRAGEHPSERSTRRLDVELPEGVGYRAGDHLGVLPRNPEGAVRRAANRFGFAGDETIRLRAASQRRTPLPIDRPIAVLTLLRDFPELQAVATRSQIEILAAHTPCPPERARLTALTGDDEAAAAHYRDDVMARRKSLIDLLEETPSCALPFAVFLEMFSPLAPRYYSISSSPLADPRRCSITVGVVAGPARSGHGEYLGACSNYLSALAPGDAIAAFVKDNHSNFRLPDDPAQPIVMVGPGTGIAPFRGFLQERAALKRGGAEIGPAMLFFGCRRPDQDFIYAEELRQFERDGVARTIVAFSRLNASKAYVQDKIAEYHDDLWRLIESGAIIYVCGDASRMAPGVRAAFAALYSAKTGAGAAAASAWIDRMIAAGRYRVDVWSAS